MTTLGEPDGAFAKIGRAASESTEFLPMSFATSQKRKKTATVITASERFRIRLSACMKEGWVVFAEKAVGCELFRVGYPKCIVLDQTSLEGVWRRVKVRSSPGRLLSGEVARTSCDCLAEGTAK